ncbi:MULTISPECIES: competence/damage-inducible protein A [unclassified Lentimicrobium]|uniref:competence/damage-inducible protein A n=1 Tax=unclassified Lentimicrobium TaxID=2677434 RepID=UPI001554960D|nr:MULTISPECIES: competence/damage-inducible protein A [unclassified Lentimicrobium]NPD48198.1 competence/damage-inducible protein A [Lentimicrobium sp. S6]NPD86426.1 competence/damage-inducible protein A [Lentimicrobium sp. L6]
MKAKVEIINIGDELLIGQVINTNASWMGSILSEHGFEVIKITVVSDEGSQIEDAISAAMEKSDIVLISGGLGPTKDDITKKVLAEYFDSEMYFNEEAFQNIENLFKSRGFKITGVNKDQANLPKKAIAIPNKYGTAYGMWFDKDEKVIVSMPGVPFEMKTMMENEVIPRLEVQFKPEKYFQKTIMTTGVGESFLAGIIEEVEDNLPEHIKLAYLPRPGLVRLRLSARGVDEQIIKEEIQAEVDKIISILGDKIVFGYDDVSLESALAQLLLQQNKTISTAESCTGGHIAHMLTSLAGSSQYFHGSVVSYSNEAKHKVLGVKAEDIEQFGAVSETVVRQMAEGARRQLNTDYSMAISGIAGPDGGSVEKPVGYTWIAVSGPKGTISKVYQFGEHRGRNIMRASLAALNMLRVLIMDDAG